MWIMFAFAKAICQLCEENSSLYTWCTIRKFRQSDSIFAKEEVNGVKLQNRLSVKFTVNEYQKKQTRKEKKPWRYRFKLLFTLLVVRSRPLSMSEQHAKRSSLALQSSPNFLQIYVSLCVTPTDVSSVQGRNQLHYHFLNLVKVSACVLGLIYFLTAVPKWILSFDGHCTLDEVDCFVFPSLHLKLNFGTITAFHYPKMNHRVLKEISF